MIRIGVLTCVWKRKNVAAVCLRWLGDVRDELITEGIELVPLVVCSEGTESLHAADTFGVGFVEAPNHPLGAKWNAGMRALTVENVAGVVILGSDDLLSADVFRFAARELLAEKHIGGFTDLVYATFGERCVYWPGYANERSGEPIGCGRFFSAALLQKVGWAPWPDRAERSLDSHAWKRLRPMVGDERVAITTMNESGRMIDLKCDDVDMSDFESYARSGSPVQLDDVLAGIGAPEDVAAAVKKLLDPIPSEPLFRAGDALPQLTAAMIVKDEEKNLLRCLRSLVGHVDEVVVVIDERSRDRSEEIARAAGCVVAVRAWEGFAAQRNKSTALVMSPWILIIDADEVLVDAADLRSVCGREDIDGAWLRLNMKADNGTPMAADALRLVRRKKHVWKNERHNELCEIGETVRLDCTIETSYQGRMTQKAADALPDLEAMCLREPQNPRFHFQLAKTLRSLKRYPESEAAARIAIANSPPGSTTNAAAWNELCNAIAGQNRQDEALRELETATNLHPLYADLWHLKVALAICKWAEAALTRSNYSGISQVSTPELAMRAPAAGQLLNLAARVTLRPADQEPPPA